jgi:hypothetical protein
MFRRTIAAAFLVAFWTSTTILRAQLATATPDAVRVTVSMNADGTRTTYEFDSPNRRAVATTKEGKMVGSTRSGGKPATPFTTPPGN